MDRVKEVFADVQEWVVAHPKFSLCAGCVVGGMVLYAILF